MVRTQSTMKIVATENKVTILDHEAGKKTERFVDDPMMIPRCILKDWRPQMIEDLLGAFCCNNYV